MSLPGRDRDGVRSLRGGLPLVLALVALGCANDASAPDRPSLDGTPRSGGTAVLGSISDVDAWNEYVSQQSFAGNVLRRIFLRLADDGGHGLDDAGSFQPALAESWEFSEDRTALTFLLRDARWSDGRPITAADVRFTWRAQTDEGVPWIGAASKQRITDVEVLDARRVRFHFDGVYPQQLADAVEGGVVPEHVFGLVPFAAWATHDWSASPVASGPFVLERHDPQQQIVLVRNPQFHAPGLPRLDRAVIRIVPDMLTLTTLLETGEIDWIDGIAPRDAARMAASQRSRISLLPYDYPNYDFIGWNLERPPLDDPELRRALTLAIDRAVLVDDLLFGHGVVARTPVPSSWWGADGTIRPLPHDPDEARTILRRLGFATLDRGGVESPGRRLRLEILTNNGNRLRRDALVKLQEQLSRVGVEVELRPLEPKAMRQQVVDGAFDGFLGGWVFVGKVDLQSLFGSAALPPRGLNVVRYRSDEVDRALEELAWATDRESMSDPLRRIQRRIVEDQPYALLYEARRIAAHGPHLQGVVIDRPADPLARLEQFWLLPR